MDDSSETSTDMFDLFIFSPVKCRDLEMWKQMLHPRMRKRHIDFIISILDGRGRKFRSSELDEMYPVSKKKKKILLKRNEMWECCTRTKILVSRFEMKWKSKLSLSVWGGRKGGLVFNDSFPIFLKPKRKKTFSLFLEKKKYSLFCFFEQKSLSFFQSPLLFL